MSVQPAAPGGEEHDPRADYQRAERHAVYAAVQRGYWRQRFTWDREVKSWPRFGCWTVATGGLYYLAGWGHWEFRVPETGQLDWALVVVYWAVCASVVWLLWPAPRKPAAESGA